MYANRQRTCEIKANQLHIIETLQASSVKFEQGQKWKQMLISLTIKA
jgi:hypothetical protein